MNIERLTEIAEWLEAGGDDETPRFNMLVWSDKEYCGTVCCIGGYADIKWGKPRKRREARAAEALGLTELQAAQLFFGMRPDGITKAIRCYDVTAEHAAQVVRHLIATGEVDWDI